MPPFTYLFKVQEIDEKPSPNAISIPATSRYTPEDGFEVVPTAEAKALVAYLLRLKVDYELPEAKFTE
jgi:cytochrome c oxidase cbb3-type subunit 2